MTVRLYSSTDVGAPTLTMASGSLVAVLDACLVNGYGTKPSAGWTKPFADGVLRACYQQGAGGNGHYFYLDDSFGATARCRGYESMSSIDVGVGAFPLDAPLFMHKHDGVPGDRDWLLVANESTFYFVTQFDSTVTWTNASLTAFGKTRSLHPGDNFDTMLIAATSGVHAGNPSSNVALSNLGTSAGLFTVRSDIVFPGHFMARRWSGIGSAVPVAKLGTQFLSDGLYQMYQVGYNSLGFNFQSPAVNPVDGSVYVSPIKIIEDKYIRGTIPGFWQHFLGQSYMMPGDVLAGTGEHAGRQFMAVNGWNTAFFLEVSDTW